MPLDLLERALPALTDPDAPQEGTVRATRHLCTEPGHGQGTCSGGAVDWGRIADALGTRLPADYVELVQRYHGLVIDDWLGVRMPRPGLEGDYVDGIHECLLELDGAWMTGDSGGHVPYPRPGGLLPWGGSIDGDIFYWRTRPEGPEAWTVVVGGADNGWDEVDRDLTGYLAGLVLGEVEPCGGLPADFPETPSLSQDGVWRRVQCG